MHTHIQFTTFLGSCGLYCCLVPKSSPTLLRPHGLWPARLLHPRHFSGKTTGVCCHFLLQGILPTHGSNSGLLNCRQILYRLRQRLSLGNEAQVDVFLEFPCFLYDQMDVSNLNTDSSAFSKYSLYIWKFSVHVC